MKKLMIILMLGIFLISFASAAEWDNRLTYSNNDLKVDLDNWFGFGKHLGSAKLQSHPTVNYVRDVPIGNSTVMWYDFDFPEIYSKGLGDVEFTNVKTGKVVERGWKFVYWGEKETPTEKPLNCEVDKKGDNICEWVENGTRTYETWLDYNSTDIPEGIIRIGIEVESQFGDHLDGVWDIAGKKVSRHSEWSASLDANQLAWYTLNQTTGVAIDSTGNFTGTYSGSLPTAIAGVSEITNNSQDFDGTGDDVNTTSVILLEDVEFTVNLWAYPTSEVTYFNALSQHGAGTARIAQIQMDKDVFKWQLLSESSAATIFVNTDVYHLDNWQMVTFVRNATSIVAYFNGTLEDVTLWNGNDNALQGTPMYIGVRDGTFDRDFTGRIDEVGVWDRALTQEEITILFNDGDGCTYQLCDEAVPTMTLNAPVNSFNSSSQTIVFNGTGAISGGSLANISYIFNEAYNGTNSSVFNGTLTQFSRTFADGNHNWTMEVCSATDVCANATSRNFTIDTNLPSVNITHPYPSGVVINFHDNSTNQTINWTATDVNINTCWVNYNFTNRSVTCNLNTSSFTLTDQRNVTFWGNDTVGNLASSFRTWSYLIVQNSQTFNASSFETASESFFTNITTNGTAPTSALLVYDGTSNTAIVTNTAGDNYNLSATIDIPITVETKSFFFNVTVGGTEASANSSDQIINLTNFSFCTSGTPFINISFRNETVAEENITALIASTWNYWLGSGDTFKTLSFTNASENLNYRFCLVDLNRTLNTNVSIDYSNDVSQQRTFQSEPILTNSTLNQVLWLLPSSAGLFQAFATIDTISNVVPNVVATIRRTISGVPVIIAAGTTDSSGFISFFLDPTTTYDATFTKTGFADNTFSFFPATTARNVVMGSTGASNFTGSNISLDVTWVILPTNSSLNNNTNVVFSFNVSGSTGITLISMNITNASSNQFLFQSNAGEGIVSGTLNTGTNTTFIGQFIIQTLNETITLSQIWTIGPTFIGDYSIFRQLDLFTTYGFSDFIRLLMVLVSIIGVLVFMTSTEISDSGESKIIVSLMMVWGFSIVGWLNTGLSTNSPLSQFSNQYGIAILATGAGFFFIFRRIFIRRI